MKTQNTQAQPSFKALTIRGNVKEGTLTAMQIEAKKYRHTLEKGLLPSNEMVYCIQTQGGKLEKSLKMQLIEIIRQENSPANSFLGGFFNKKAKVKVRPLSEIFNFIKNYDNKNPREAAKKMFKKAATLAQKISYA